MGFIIALKDSMADGVAGFADGPAKNKEQIDFITGKKTVYYPFNKKEKYGAVLKLGLYMVQGCVNRCAQVKK